VIIEYWLDNLWKTDIEYYSIRYHQKDDPEYWFNCYNMSKKEKGLSGLRRAIRRYLKISDTDFVLIKRKEDTI
jgi:hypothetical protein